MTWPAIVFGALVGNQLVATVAFIVVYRRESGWRRSAVGRHLMYWAVVSGVLDAMWLLLLLAQWPWLVLALLAVQAVLGLVTWQRVALVWRGRSRPVKE